MFRLYVRLLHCFKNDVGVNHADDLENFAGWTFDEHIRLQTSFFALEGGQAMRLDYLVCNIVPMPIGY